MLILKNTINNFPEEIRDYEVYPIDVERFSFKNSTVKTPNLLIKKQTSSQKDKEDKEIKNDKTEKPKIKTSNFSLIKKQNTQDIIDNDEQIDEVLHDTDTTDTVSYKQSIDINGLQRIIEHKMSIDNVINADISEYDW